MSNITAKSKDDVRRKHNQHIENWPDVAAAQHVADYLGISRRRVYELFQLSPQYGGIKNFDVGKSKRVKKVAFLRWLDEKVEEKVKLL